MQMQNLKLREDIFDDENLTKFDFYFLKFLNNSTNNDKDIIFTLLENCFASVTDKVTKRFQNF